MLNGFVGEFLVLNGTFEHHAAWAIWAAVGVIFSALYLLWAYQRTFFGEITVEKNRTLLDADLRERSLLWVMCAMILFMGIGSTVFTSRTENTVRQVLEQMQPPPATQPVNAKVDDVEEFEITTTPNQPSRTSDAVEMHYVPKKVKAAR